MELEGLTPEQLEAKQTELTQQAQDILKNIQGSSDADMVKAALDDVSKLRLEIQPLVIESNKRMTEDLVKGFSSEVAQLTETLSGMRESVRMPGAEQNDDRNGDLTYQDGKFSLFGDIRRAKIGGKAGGGAYDRLEEFFTGKAGEYVEGTDAAGGYLVRPEFVGTLPPRLIPFNLVDIIPEVRVNGDQIEFTRFTESGSLAGWVGEMPGSDKPQLTNQSFASVFVSVFTAAAHAISSNQLLEDSSVDVIIRNQLERGVRRTIEDGILNGTGTGMPTGILRTAATGDLLWDDASPTVGELLPMIAQAITQVMDSHLSSPTHIIMRPQLWTKIITDAAATGTFTFGAGLSDPGVRTASDSFPQKSLFGLPVVTTPLITNTNVAGAQGASTGGAQGRIIVSDLSEQLLLNRSDMQVDLSEHLLFLRNATVFRGERRVGFTAARYPLSTTVIRGTGLTGAFA